MERNEARSATRREGEPAASRRRTYEAAAAFDAMDPTVREVTRHQRRRLLPLPLTTERIQERTQFWTALYRAERTVQEERQGRVMRGERVLADVPDTERPHRNDAPAQWGCFTICIRMSGNNVRHEVYSGDYVRERLNYWLIRETVDRVLRTETPAQGGPGNGSETAQSGPDTTDYNAAEQHRREMDLDESDVDGSTQSDDESGDSIASTIGIRRNAQRMIDEEGRPLTPPSPGTVQRGFDSPPLRALHVERDDAYLLPAPWRVDPRWHAHHTWCQSPDAIRIGPFDLPGDGRGYLAPEIRALIYDVSGCRIMIHDSGGDQTAQMTVEGSPQLNLGTAWRLAIHFLLKWQMRHGLPGTGLSNDTYYALSPATSFEATAELITSVCGICGQRPMPHVKRCIICGVCAGLYCEWPGAAPRLGSRAKGCMIWTKQEEWTGCNYICKICFARMMHRFEPNIGGAIARYVSYATNWI